MQETEDPIDYQLKLNKREDSILSSIGILVFSMLIIIFIYTDYVRYSESVTFTEVLLLKLTVFLASLLVFIYLKVSKDHKYYSLVIFTWLIIVISMIHYVGYLRPSEYIASLALESAIILSVFVIFRNKLFLQIIASIYLSIGLLWQLYTIEATHAGITYFSILFTVIAINIIGIFVTYTISKYRGIVLRYLEN